MTDREFCFWLQGFVELNGDLPTKEQWKSIKEHLQLVFTKVTSKVETRESFIDKIKDIPQIPPYDFPRNWPM